MQQQYLNTAKNGRLNNTTKANETITYSNDGS
jgi:hypothetical protein